MPGLQTPTTSNVLEKRGREEKADGLKRLGQLFRECALRALRTLVLFAAASIAIGGCCCCCACACIDGATICGSCALRLRCLLLLLLRPSDAAGFRSLAL
jgi:hypothetical protein